MPSKAKVGDYMTEKVHSLSYNATIEEALDSFLGSTHQNFPVVRNGNLVGIITAKDLLRNYNNPKKKVKNILKRKLAVARPDLGLDDAARILFRYGYNKLPVVNGNGKLVGIISNADILRSHIERVTPRKVKTVRRLIESEHGVRLEVMRYSVPVSKLHPTQDKIYADELEGREYELKRGLAEPIIVVKRRNRYILVDGHHRAVAAKNLGIDELMAHVLKFDGTGELGMEKSAREKNLITLDDITIIDYAQHPLVEITTRLIKKRDLE
ncbi:MAG: CBS domain-containing protein [Candidatus Altiarchaeales archaeon]|nr:CBS domain-containing protein [Candidatus Altiarchaeales archaeon]